MVYEKGFNVITLTDCTGATSDEAQKAATNGTYAMFSSPMTKDEFLNEKKQIQRVVETLTILDDPNFTSDSKNVEIAIRLVGTGKDIVFGVSHVYWA